MKRFDLMNEGTLISGQTYSQREKDEDVYCRDQVNTNT